MDTTLPFLRGSTHKEFDTSTADPGVQFQGQTFRANDNNPGDGTGHTTKQHLTLRVLKNKSGAALNWGVAQAVTAPQRGHRALRASTSDSRSLSEGFNGFLASEGGFGYCFDDAYPNAKTFAANDLVYVVESGLCRVPLELAQTKILGPGGTAALGFAGQQMAWGITGRAKRARTGDRVFGIAMQTFTSAQTGQGVMVQVIPPFNQYVRYGTPNAFG